MLTIVGELVGREGTPILCTLCLCLAIAFYILRLLKIPVVKGRLFILFLFSINLRFHENLICVIFQIPA